MLNCSPTNKFKLPTRNGNKMVKSYSVWRSMLQRCYNNTNLKYRPSYNNCYVCEEWHEYSNFKIWFDKNYIDGYELDKDILFNNNKEYSPNKCKFVPSRINSLLIKPSNDSKLPRGICYHKENKKYVVNLSIGEGTSKSKYLGSFTSLNVAKITYNSAKEQYIKNVAKEYYNNNLIDVDIYNALLRKKVK